MCFIMPVLYCLDSLALWQVLKLRCVSLVICFSLSRLFWLFEVSCISMIFKFKDHVYFCKKSPVDFSSNMWNSGKYSDLDYIKYFIPWARNVLPLIWVFNFFQQSFVIFSEYKSCTSLINSVLKYFILLDAIISRAVFLIYFWIVHCQCIVKQQSFFVLILCSTILLNLLALIVFWWILWDFLCIGLCSTDRVSFT